MTSSSSRLSPRFRVAAIAGTVAFLLAVGAGGAWAYWTAQATASTSAVTASVGVTQSGFENPATTTYTPSSLSSTRTFTVTNTSAITGTATANLSTPESYASNLTLRVWPVASVGACTATPPGSGVTTGTWSSLTLTATLAAGASQTYCALTTIADWKTVTTPTGTATVNPVATISVDASGWAASAPTATHIQRTAGMFPVITAPLVDPSLASSWFTIRNAANTGYCLDDKASGSAGTWVITWGCHTGANQRWQFVPVTSSDPSLVTIRPRSAPTTRLQTSAAGAVTIETAAGSTTQQWYVQNVSTGNSPVYQLVSASTGRCLPLGTASVDTAPLQTVTCDAAAAQLSFPRDTLSFSSSGATATITWATQTGALMTVVQQNGTSWVAVKQIAASDTSEAFTVSPNNQTSTYRIVFGSYVTGATVPGTADVAFGSFAIKNVTTGVLFTTTTLTAVSGFG